MLKKRIHIKKAAYLLTTNTQGGVPFFQEDIFCNIFIDVLANCQKIKPFNLIAFKINPDHIHVILQPTGDFNISQIMQSVKKTASLQINQVMHSIFPKSQYSQYEWTPTLKVYRQCYLRKFNYKGIHSYPKFDWQDGFDDRLIKTKEAFKNRVFYVQNQHIRHDLPENKFLYVADDIPDDILFIEENGK